MNSSAIRSISQVEAPARTCFVISSSTPNTMRPAARIVSSSAFDLRVTTRLPPEDGADSVANLLDRADGVDGVDGTAVAVPLEHRRGLLPIRLEADGDGRGIVIGAVLDPAALLDAGEELGVGDIEEEDVVHLAAEPFEDGLDADRLGDGAHDAVEDDPGRGLGDLVADHAEDEVIGDELA